MNELHSELLFEINFDVDSTSQRVGAGPDGKRDIFPISGGRFEGPRLSGVVLPNGGDWLRVRDDGVGILDVRVTLQANDDALIYMWYRGIMHFPEQARAKARSGERVEPSEYYIRSTPVFETAASQYEWLNRIVAVGVGWRLDEGVGYRVYEIL